MEVRDDMRRWWRREEVPRSKGPKVPWSKGPRYLKVIFKYRLDSIEGDSIEGPSCFTFKCKTFMSLTLLNKI